MNNSKTDILALFEGECEGENEQVSDHTPRTRETGGQEGAPAAGEQKEASREEAFRALMEGEYKDLFTAYFQQAFNRRFKEHKQIKEELEATRPVLQAVRDRFDGVTGEALLDAIRAETVLKNAPTEAKENTSPAPMQSVESARAEAERRVLENIRARGLRPAENAVFSTSEAPQYRGGAMTRAERAEMARRAANGERIEL